MKSGIYAITNMVNGKCYIGSAVTVEKRWKDHRRMLAQAKHHSIKLQRAWVKHGEAAFTFKVLLYCERANLIFYEQRAIDAFCALGGGYNMSPTAGSTLGTTPSLETREKQRAAKLGGKLSSEHKAKIGAASKGNKHCLGKNLSEEHKQKLRGRKHSVEAKEKIGAANLGKKWPGRGPMAEETKAKIAAAHKGRPKTPEHIEKVAAFHRGRKFSEEHKRKLSDAKVGKVQPAAIAAMRMANMGRKMSPEAIAKRQASRYGKLEKGQIDFCF